MHTLRRYVDSDWQAVLNLCLLAFAPACESLERLLGTDLDWRTSLRRHLRSLTRPGERSRLVVAEVPGAVVGVVHYQIDRDTQTGNLGLSAVHPARQGEGIGSLMYSHVLDAMRAQGLKYATAETGGDSSHAPARRAYEKVGFVALPMVHHFMGLDGRARAPRRSRGPASRGRAGAARRSARRGQNKRIAPGKS
jgi:GNAT superfamily N-acetyltransferase